MLMNTNITTKGTFIFNNCIVVQSFCYLFLLLRKINIIATIQMIMGIIASATKPENEIKYINIHMESKDNGNYEENM